jgi:hypothetical protein
MVFNNGIKSAKQFSMRLFCKYYRTTFAKISGPFLPRQLKLDPVRIGFIRSHVASRFGEDFSNEQWRECLQYINKQKGSYFKIQQKYVVREIKKIKISFKYFDFKKS